MAMSDLKAPDIATKRMTCLFISVMGILYRDIVIHISEDRDVFLDIIKLALVESPNHQRRTLGRMGTGSLMPNTNG